MHNLCVRARAIYNTRYSGVSRVAYALLAAYSAATATGAAARSSKYSPHKSPMDQLTAFGLFAVTAMLICYALEKRAVGIQLDSSHCGAFGPT